jgi:hypothetical protein
MRRISDRDTPAKVFGDDLLGGKTAPSKLPSEPVGERLPEESGVGLFVFSRNHRERIGFKVEKLRLGHAAQRRAAKLRPALSLTGM